MKKTRITSWKHSAWRFYVARERANKSHYAYFVVIRPSTSAGPIIRARVSKRSKRIFVYQANAPTFTEESGQNEESEIAFPY